MSRTVNIQEADGSVTPYTDVPDNVTDEQVATRLKGKTVGPLKDLGESIKSGAVAGSTQLGLAVPKIITGLIGNVGKYTDSPKIVQYAKERGKEIQAGEAEADKYGASYAPGTKLGEYAKAATAGAMQLPLSRNPLSLLRDVALGGTGGALAQGAHEAGGGQASSVAASMLPFALLAARQGTTPSFGSRKAREAAAALTPEQRAAINLSMARGQEAGVDPMLWQVAPEGSQLRTLGLGASRLPGADALQRRLVQQTAGHANAAGTAAIQRVMDPIFEPINQLPVNPAQAEAIRNRVAAVGGERHLPPGDPTGQAVAGEAARFGAEADVRVPQQPLLDELQQISGQMRSGTMTPEMRARRAELVGILGGSLPYPTTRQFQPGVTSLGEVESIRQDIGNTGSGRPTAPQGASIAMRQAVRDAVEGTHPGAGYAAALQRHGEVSNAVNAVRETSEATAGRVSDPFTGGARTEVGPEVAYALATNPMWAAMPPVRRMAEKSNARNLARILQANTLEELTRAAARNPQKEALISALRMMAAPAQQGEFDPEMLTR